MGQFIGHYGFMILDEWDTPGKYFGWDEGNRRRRPGRNYKSAGQARPRGDKVQYGETDAGTEILALRIL